MLMNRRALLGAPTLADQMTKPPMMAAVPQKPGFDDPGGLADRLKTLAGHLMQLGGLEDVGTSTLNEVGARQQAAREASMAQLRRGAEFEDFTRRHDYEVAHPKAPADDVFTRTLSAAGIDPASPEAQALYRQRANTLANPAPQWVPDGLGGGRFVQPPSASASPQPSAPVGKLTPMGGAVPGGPRTFPVR